MKEYQEVDEINLIDLLFYCLKRWRGIVVCMVCMAIVAGAYKYQLTIVENQIKKEKQSYHIITESSDEEIENEPIVFEKPASSAVSFSVMGMIGGAFFACLVFCMSYILSGKLQSENNFQKKFGMPLLGIIREVESKKRVFRFVDRWICRLEEGPFANISRLEQIKIAIVNVQTAIHKKSKEKIKKVMLAGSISENDVKEVCEQLVEEIGDITFSPYKQILFQAIALKKLDYYEGIIFIEKKGKSYEKLIKQERELAIERDIKVLGTIIC